MESKDIGSIEFYSSDFERNITIRDYLLELLCVVWNEEESFSGKRAFGNSGWQHDVGSALVENNAVSNGSDHTEIDKIITEYIVEYM